MEGEGERVDGFQVKANGGGEQKCDSWEVKDEHGLAKVRGRRGTTGKSAWDRHLSLLTPQAHTCHSS